MPTVTLRQEAAADKRELRCPAQQTSDKVSGLFQRADQPGSNVARTSSLTASRAVAVQARRWAVS